MNATSFATFAAAHGLDVIVIEGPSIGATAQIRGAKLSGVEIPTGFACGRDGALDVLIAKLEGRRLVVGGRAIEMPELMVA